MKRDELQALLDSHGTFVKVSDSTGIPVSTLKSRAQRLGVKRPPTIKVHAMRSGVEISGDAAVITSDPSPDLGDIAEMIRARGLDPDEWEVKNAVLNCWDSNAGDGQIIELRQLKIHLVRKVPIDFILPVTDVKPRTPRKPVKSDTHTIVLLPDQHAPYEDRACHEAVLAMLAHVQPDEVGLLGDLVDLPTISKHRDNPAWSASVTECIQGGFELLRDYTEATTSRFWMLKGNHCFRLETELLARAERMYGIAPASIDGEEQDQALSLKRLLHLDRLGVELIEPPRAGDGYEFACHKITDKFEARHGWITGQNSAQKSLDRVGRSLVVGHTHRQVLTRRTYFNGITHRTIQAAECGTLRGIEGGGGFAVNPDWQVGLCVAQIGSDGAECLDFASFDDGVLRWRGERYK
jgi:predicted phosphodiesterase